MGGFVKVFSTILTSSIWQEDKDTRLLWVTMLALADASGHVDASLPGLAHAANLTVEECEAAIRKLEAPDKYSRTTAEDGRRVKRVPGGWQVLNYATYREKGRSVDRREYLRQKQSERRARLKQAHTETASTMSTNVNQCQPIAEAEAEAYPPHIPPRGGSRSKKNRDFSDQETDYGTVIDTSP